MVLLSGERYGRRMLPRRMPAAELDRLLTSLPPSDARARAALSTWYRVDANALPEPEAVLLRAEGLVAWGEAGGAAPAPRSARMSSGGSLF